MIQRTGYLGRLAQLRENQQVKVLSGVRGCGKTTLLAMYIDWLKRTGVDDQQIIFVSMEDPESETLPHYQGLYSHIKKRLRRDRLTYVFIDEIQLCADYEKAIDGLLTNRQADLYVSISNACAFSNAPHTEIRVLPLSFAERLIFSRVKIPGRAEELQAFSLPDRPGQAAAQVPAQLAAQTERRLPRQRAQMEKYLQSEAFNEYLSFGGFPFAAALGGDASLTRHYVDGIYSAILVKDVARQAGINDIPLLALVAKVMGQNAGRPLSSKKVGSAISAKGRKISCNTVETYMQALTTAFAFYHAERFDIKTGKRLKTLGKYYAADTGMLNLSLESPDLDGQLENVVYLELLRRGFQVCVGKHDRDEVNFAAFGQPPASGAAHDNAQGNDGKTYFQVAPSVRDRAVLAGKLSPLERIRDNHPKYILSLDETPFRANYDGIVQKNLVDWLLEK